MKPAMQAAATTVNQGRTRKGEFLLVLLCFALSGFAALLYQTAWLRQFSIVFGTSELAVATVLAAYMGGLALGAMLGGKLVGRLRRPVLAYGLLELGIALGALCVPAGLRLAQTLQAVLIGDQVQIGGSGTLAAPLFYAVAAFVVMLVPTTCMGATLPLLTQHAVRRESQIGMRTGLLYAVNTAGAVLGTLVAAFVLLPALGLASTVYVGIAVNGLVFLLAAWVSWGCSARDQEEAPTEVSVERSPIRREQLILPLIAVSGMTSFTYEVLWTRLFGQVLGGSIHAFATMLATFLVGITLGSALGAVLARTRKGSVFGFLLSQLGVASFSMLVWNQLDELPGRFVALNQENGRNVMDSARLIAWVLLPSTLCIGATFPFALRIIANSARDAGQASARVYAWNTLGAIVGALLSGFFLIPGLGFAWAIRLAVGANLGLAAMSAWLLGLRRQVCVVVALLAVLIGVVFKAETPEQLLRYSPVDGIVDGQLLHLEAGRSATVLALEQAGSFQVRSNGLPEAGVDLQGAIRFGRLAPKFMALLPIIARPSAKSMMVVGFGCGVTLESIPTTIQEIDVVELEPEIIRANQTFAGRRAIDPLADPRLRLISNDARGALMLTKERWDIIVSQASHPWTAGASHLYTHEFLALAKAHLNEGGVFVQWMDMGFLTEELFASLGATMLSSFKHVRLYRPSSSMLVFLASDMALELERELLRSGQPFANDPAWWRTVGMGSVSDVLAYLALEHQALAELCEDAPICTDDANLLAMRSRSFRDDSDLARLETMLSARDPLLEADGPLRKDLAASIDETYLARRLVSAGRSARAKGLLELMDPGSPQQLRATGNAATTPSLAQWRSGSRDLQTAFQLDPNNVEGRFLFLRDNLPYVARSLPGTEQLQAMAEQLTGPALLVYRNWQAMAAGRWNEIASSEAALSQVPASAPWFLHATRQRAQWRSHADDSQERKQLAQEALPIIDSALLLELDPHLVLLRAEVAQAADRPQHFIESMNVLARFVGPWRKGLPPLVVQELSAQLPRLKEFLDTLEGDPRISTRRLEQVRSSLGE